MKAKAPSKKKKTVRHAAAAPPALEPKDGELDQVLTEVTAVPAAEAAEEMVVVACPYCSEDFELRVTTAEDGQARSEECPVCARAISLFIEWEDGQVDVNADRAQ